MTTNHWHASGLRAPAPHTIEKNPAMKGRRTLAISWPSWSYTPEGCTPTEGKGGCCTKADSGVTLDLHDHAEKVYKEIEFNQV